MAHEELMNEAKEAILNYDRAAAEDVAQRALAAGLPPGDIMAGGFIPGIQELGELFETGEVFLPELMLAGEAMKAAMKVLGPALKAAGGKQVARPIIILGTVEGDIHEIGKNIVGILLETSGYEVIDLGMDVKADTFVKAAKEHGAKIIGASALLTTTMEHQREVVSKVRSEKLDIKVLVGGSPVTQEWANEIGADGYAQDAPDAVKLVDSIVYGWGHQ